MKALFIFMNIISFSRGFQFGRTSFSPQSISPVVLQAKKSTAAPGNGDFWVAEMDCWRPTVNDVERISWGKPAKKKGTGSRGVPHRLNEEERFLFDQARRKGFLEVGGSGWRAQRREAPLLNTYRSLCDARGQASIVLHKGNTGVDELVVDISPLRKPEAFAEVAKICQEKHDGAEIVFQEYTMNEDDDDKYESSSESMNVDSLSDMWENRPIYQLPPYCIAWELERSDAKSLGKEMAEAFLTKEGKKSSKKPVGVKSGKGRRHGGYGIG